MRLSRLDDGVCSGPLGARRDRQWRACRCTYCRRQVPNGSLTWDHIEPLSRGGEHLIENLVIACRSCNARKGNRFLLEWVLDGDAPISGRGVRQYGPNKAIERRAICMSVLHEIGQSYEQIGRLFGVSRQRVQQIIVTVEG